MKNRRQFSRSSLVGTQSPHRSGAYLQTNPDEETGIHIKVDAGFQFMHELETGVHLNTDDGLHFIRPFRVRTISASGFGHLIRTMRMRRCVWVVKTATFCCLIRVLYVRLTISSLPSQWWNHTWMTGGHRQTNSCMILVLLLVHRPWWSHRQDAWTSY